MTCRPRYRGAVQTPGGLFDGVFSRGQVDTSGQAWLQAMLDTEAALARALEAAGLAAPGAGAAVTAAARADAFRPGPAGPAGGAHRQPGARAGPGAGPAAAAGRARPPCTRARPARTSSTPRPCCWPGRRWPRSAADLAAAAAAAASLAAAHRDTLMIGRTLLQQAVPVTFGLVAAGWLTGLDEARGALARVAASRLAVQFGGAAGTLARAGRRRARGGRAAGRANWAWPCPRCPGTPTGCGSSRSARRAPG